MVDLLAEVAVNGFRPADLALTCLGLRFVNWNCDGAEFKIVFGKSQECRVHPVLADFLSPKISRLRRSDASTDQFIFEDRSDCAYHAFTELLSHVVEGRTLHVSSSNFEGLVRVACELENEEIFSFLLSMIDLARLDVNKALSLLGIEKVKSRYPALVELVASNFEEISHQNLLDVSLETAALILSHPSLRVLSEDSVYNSVRLRAEHDPSFTSLFEFVYFEFMSKELITDFVVFAEQKLIGHLNSAIWRRIARLFVGEESEYPRQQAGRIFVHDPGDPLNGIITHLTRECGGNVHMKGVMEVTASSFISGYEPQNIANIGSDSCFASNDKDASWICYDFKEKRVLPTSYSIRSSYEGRGGTNPKSWCVEVSNDGEMWETLDTRVDNNDLNGAFVTHNFPVGQTPCKASRFIRLRQTGRNHVGSNHLCMSSFETLASSWTSNTFHLRVW